MLSYAFLVLALGVAYAIGSVPFAYLIVRWRKGIDIRTVGSGNVGATNAGRLLGFRYFLLVFALDLVKGFLPTWGLPKLIEALVHVPWPAVGVPIALATILGHNFPLFLGFRGGKGISTSLGAVLALDPIASGGAVATFVVVLLLTRYVSVSSTLGAVGFLGTHFATIEAPWSRAQAGMSAFTILLTILVIVRHRKNFARIATGTEPKVPLGGKQNRPLEEAPK